MIRGERENDENIYFDERDCDKGQMNSGECDKK